jgi:hypothetical protein
MCTVKLGAPNIVESRQVRSLVRYRRCRVRLLARCWRLDHQHSDRSGDTGDGENGECGDRLTGQQKGLRCYFGDRCIDRTNGGADSRVRKADVSAETNGTATTRWAQYANRVTRDRKGLVGNE